MQVPMICFLPRSKCQSGKSVPSRRDRGRRILAMDLTSSTSANNGCATSGYFPSRLSAKASGMVFKSTRDAYLNRVSPTSSENIHSSPLAESLLYARNALGGESEIVDRKSTRLNSSHSQISYAVFC